MPIANCVVSAELDIPPSNAGCLVERWSKHADVAADEMTINLISSTAQFGKAYAVVANLYLPDLWPADKATALQQGLANALSEHFQIDTKQLLVMTQPLASGQVVDAGQQVTW